MRPACRTDPTIQRAAARSSSVTQTSPSSSPAASIDIGSIEVSVIPGDTFTSRNCTSPAAVTIASVRDRSRSPSASWARTAADATRDATSGASRAGVWYVVVPAVYRDA
jgi:hypothetical protein